MKLLWTWMLCKKWERRFLILLRNENIFNVLALILKLKQKHFHLGLEPTKQVSEAQQSFSLFTNHSCAQEFHSSLTQNPKRFPLTEPLLKRKTNIKIKPANEFKQFLLWLFQFSCEPDVKFWQNIHKLVLATNAFWKCH